MKKSFLYFLRVIVIIYLINSISLVIAGLVVAVNEKNAVMITISVLGVFLFILFVLLDKKLKTKIKNFDNSQKNTANTYNNLQIDIHDEIKSDYQNALYDEKNSNNPKFHRTEQEDELSFQFLYNSKNYELAQKEIIAFEHLTQKANELTDIKEIIKCYQDALIHYENAKSICYRTKGGTIWFQDMYEHLHNSENDCFSYGDNIKGRIFYYNKLLFATNEVITVINNSGGIYQKDLKNYVSYDDKIIKQAVKYLFETNKVIKTKKSNYIYLQPVLSVTNK